MSIQKNGSREEEHDNVMLLAMSTLPSRPKFNTYQVKGEDGRMLYFKSLSQMEPHTKYVLRLLADRKEKLDRIVILESRKAREEQPDNWERESATGLYVKRIRKYCGRTEEIGIDVTDELDKLAESPIDSRLYQDRFPEVYTIHLEEKIFFWKAVQKIMGPDWGRTVHLYMDMQGGDRNAVSQMNAIVTLLKRQKVIIKGRYANDFEPKRRQPLHTIRDASREYQTYDLITAMDVFSQYGWGNRLDEYFRGKVRSNSSERKLIRAINEASSAISKCNGDGFNSAVRKIEELEPRFKEPEMEVVYQDIRENYRELFGAKYRFVEQIRWCLDKSFLQQALTIFEAKMPYEFIHSGLIYYMKKSGSQEERKIFLTVCEELYYDLPAKDRYRMRDLNHYLIKTYCSEYDRGSREFFFTDPQNLLSFGLDGWEELDDSEKKEKRSEVISLLNKYRELSGLRNQINHAVAGRHNAHGFFSYMQGKYKKDRNWKEQGRMNYEQQIRDYLDQWQSLADLVPDEIRNQVEDMS